MWIFTREGYFSTVQKDCGADEVLVRSRQRCDLVRLGEKLGLKLQIKKTLLSDYRYRAVREKGKTGLGISRNRLWSLITIISRTVSPNGTTGGITPTCDAGRPCWLGRRLRAQ